MLSICKIYLNVPLYFLQCFHLFKCLGLPCLKSEGEGEALCAFLNNEQVIFKMLLLFSEISLHRLRIINSDYINFLIVFFSA